MKMRLKHTAIALAVCLILSLPLYTVIARQLRIRQFVAVDANVSQCGGSLTWELVDGNYTVRLSGHAATNESVIAVTNILRDLPTGLTLVGPGESRLFHIVLASAAVREDGFASLLRLPIEFLFLDGGTITDQTAQLIANHHSLIWLQLDNVSVSEDALRLIRKGNPVLRITPENSQLTMP